MKSKSKATLVVGGSGDIGRHIVEELLKENTQVIATYNTNKSGLESLLNDYPSLEIEQLDLLEENEEKIKNLVWHLYEKNAENLGLIYAAGIFIPDTTLKIHENTSKIWRINYYGAVKFINYFLRRGSGDKRRKVIAVISSIASKGEGSATTYSTTKSALEAFVRSAGEYNASRFNVRTLIIKPTWVDGNFLRKSYPEEIILQLSRAVPTYKLPTSEEVAKILVANYNLLFETDAYNNVEINIDGGRSK